MSPPSGLKGNTAPSCVSLGNTLPPLLGWASHWSIQQGRLAQGNLPPLSTQAPLLTPVLREAMVMAPRVWPSSWTARALFEGLVTPHAPRVTPASGLLAHVGRSPRPPLRRWLTCLPRTLLKGVCNPLHPRVTPARGQSAQAGLPPRPLLQRVVVCPP